jgi:hypothetical protein
MRAMLREGNRQPARIAEQLATSHDHDQHPLAHVPDLADIPFTRCVLRTPRHYQRVNAWVRTQIP